MRSTRRSWAVSPGGSGATRPPRTGRRGGHVAQRAGPGRSSGASRPARDCGVYIAVFRLARRCRLTVGRLGTYAFQAGLYFYVGTAQRGLSKRLARHARRAKRLHWHVDYLSRRATMLGAILIAGGRRRECEIAAELARDYVRPVARFGASDCRCGGHLFFVPDWT